MRNTNKIGWILGLLIMAGMALAACNLPLPDSGILSNWLDRGTPTGMDQTIPPNITPDASLTPVSEEEPCGYQWATQPLPEVTDNLQRYFIEAGYLDLKVTAEAFGENCVRQDGSVARFLTMYTDIRISAPVTRLGDSKVLAEQTETILRMVLDYPAEQLPGSLEGYLGINFVDPQGQAENLWFKRLVGKEALDKGLSGEELLIYLRGN